MPSREIITRRNLPHWYVPNAWHFVTYRLHNTMPQQVLLELRERRQQRFLEKPVAGVSLGQHRATVHKQFFAEYDRYLDCTCPIDWLARPPIAALIRGNLYHHRGSKYHLLAYCVMPNHVHALVQPLEADGTVATSGPLVSPATSEPLVATGLAEDFDLDERSDADSPLAKIMHSWKSYTAHEANKLLQRSGQFWQHESFDHWVRDEEELERIVVYINWNPVKAGLVREPQEWYFGSAHDRFLDDGSRLGFLR